MLNKWQTQLNVKTKHTNIARALINSIQKLSKYLHNKMPFPAHIVAFACKCRFTFIVRPPRLQTPEPLCIISGRFCLCNLDLEKKAN